MKSVRMNISHLDETIEQYHAALGELMTGNAAALKKSYSRHDDASLANPFGPVARGWAEVEKAVDAAANFFHEGVASGFERVAAFACTDLAYIVELERLRARLGAGEEVAPFSLRVTTVFRREGESWKVLHRHADPITRPRTAESLVPEDERAGQRRGGDLIV